MLVGSSEIESKKPAVVNKRLAGSSEAEPSDSFNSSGYTYTEGNSAQVEMEEEQRSPLSGEHSDADDDETDEEDSDDNGAGDVQDAETGSGGSSQDSRDGIAVAAMIRFFGELLVNVGEAGRRRVNAVGHAAQSDSTTSISSPLFPPPMMPMNVFNNFNSQQHSYLAPSSVK
eukprot:Selendium_serpulae@DN845_c0_g1_i1.p1